MKLLRQLFRFYINSSIHVALAVCALVAITSIEFNLEVTLAFWLFVFFGSITGYNFVKYASIAGLHHRSLADSLKTIQIFSLICFGILFFTLFFLSLKTLVVSGGFAALTFFYAVPLLKHKNLRTFSGLKIFIVALVWAGVTVFVPMVASEMQLTSDSWITLFQRILFVTVLTLPFEIRDLVYDDIQLGTLPQQLGLKATKILGIGMLLVMIVLDGFKDEMSHAYFIGIWIICGITGAMLLVAKREQSKYYASFWVEGLPIIWLAILLWFRHFLL